jgi:hypothetical protein
MMVGIKHTMLCLKKEEKKGLILQWTEKSWYKTVGNQGRDYKSHHKSFLKETCIRVWLKKG